MAFVRRDTVADCDTIARNVNVVVDIDDTRAAPDWFVPPPILTVSVLVISRLLSATECPTLPCRSTLPPLLLMTRPECAKFFS